MRVYLTEGTPWIQMMTSIRSSKMQVLARCHEAVLTIMYDCNPDDDSHIWHMHTHMNKEKCTEHYTFTPVASIGLIIAWIAIEASAGV